MTATADKTDTTRKKYVFDSHKLLYHLDRVQAWLDGERIIPVHLDVSPAGLCNQRCIYCLFAHQAERQRREKWILPGPMLIDLVKDAARLGVRSIAFIGDGEPFVNPHTPEAIVTSAANGVDCSVATNGALLKESYIPDILEALTWMRFSLCAAEPELYSHVQGARPGDFERAVENMTTCARVKRERNLPVDIGVVFLLMPQNHHQLLDAVEVVRQTGVDYLYIKQYVAYDKNDFQFDFSFYDGVDDLLRQAEAKSTDDFAVMARWNNIKRTCKEYDRCLSLPFLVHVGGNGRLYPCAPLIGDDTVCYGDLHEQSLEQVLRGDQMWDVVERMAREYDVHAKCPSSCRQDYLNSFCWQLKHPPRHVNFI